MYHLICTGVSALNVMHTVHVFNASHFRLPDPHFKMQYRCWCRPNRLIKVYFFLHVFYATACPSGCAPPFKVANPPTLYDFRRTTQWSTTFPSKVNVHHAINFRASRVAIWSRSTPQIWGERNPRAPSCGLPGTPRPDAGLSQAFPEAGLSAFAFSLFIFNSRA